MQKAQIKTLADAEKVVSEEHGHLYLISFVDAEGRPGSTVIGMTKDEPLYRPYFIFNEVNKDAHLLTILGIVKLTADEPEIINIGINEVQKKRIDMLKNFEESAEHFDLPPGSVQTIKDFIHDMRELI